MSGRRMVLVYPCSTGSTMSVYERGWRNVLRAHRAMRPAVGHSYGKPTIRYVGGPHS